MKRFLRIAWNALVAISAMALLALLLAIGHGRQPYRLGSTDIFARLFDDDHLVIDIHSPRGWWSLCDAPLPPIWIVPAVIPVCWLQVRLRRAARARGATPRLIYPQSILLMLILMWPPLVIAGGDRVRIQKSFEDVLEVFIVLCLLVFGCWYFLRLVRYAVDYPARKLRRRIERGLCVRYGYNLTGNTSGICPECGAPGFG